MLTIYHSNNLDMLTRLLADILQSKPDKNPLLQEQVLVPSPMFAEWQKQELAKLHGISAALEFSSPESFIWKISTKLLDNIPDKTNFDRDAMLWQLLKLIPKMLCRPSFKPLKNYLKNDTDSIKLLQLANQIADVFDQYLIYRPEWILSWENNCFLPEFTAGQEWQPELWQTLANLVKNQGANTWHKATLFDHLIKMLEHGPPFKRSLPQRIFIIGISTTAPSYLKTIAALSRNIDVYLFNVNPCKYYWEDNLTPNNTTNSYKAPLTNDSQTKNYYSLLDSMGKRGREYHAELSEIEAHLVNIETQHFITIKKDSLLHYIQNDILNLTDRNTTQLKTKKPMIQPDDISLAVHKCHTQMREVEVLHDQLLMRLERNPNLEPKDFLVMVPNVEAYAAAFKSVFETMKGTNRYIPYSICDQKNTAEYPLLQSLQKLICLNSSRLKATEVLGLLETPAIMRQFKINQKEFETIRLWVNKSGICWGLDDVHLQQFNLPKMYQNTWRFGLERMLLGYAIPESSGLFCDRLPLDHVHGIEAVLCGRLADFIEKIEQLINTLNQPRTAKQWQDFILDVVKTFFNSEQSDNDLQAEEIIIETLANFVEHVEQTATDCKNETLSLAIIQDYLRKKLNKNTRNSRFLAGKMNVCALTSMCSIPFKVICLLGMNDNNYPRNSPPVGFNLISKHPKRGDSSTRDDDRYRFLQALLAAQDQLYISYVAKNIKDDSNIPASVLVSELLDYCDQYFTLDNHNHTTSGTSVLSSYLVTPHPLMPFNRIYFSSANRAHFSYAKEWLPAAKTKNTAQRAFANKPLQEKDITQLTLDHLVRYYNNPCRYFFQQHLKTYFNHHFDEQEDHEPFTLNAIKAYQLKQNYIAQTVEQKTSTHDLILRSQASGLLPYNQFGRLTFDLLEKKLSKLLLPKLGELVDTLQPNLDVSLNFDGVHLTGSIKNIYQNNLLFYRSGNFSGKDVVHAWLYHLCYCATSSVYRDTIIIKEDTIKTVSHIDSTTALELLNDWVALFIKGQQLPLPFFAKTSWDWLWSIVDKKTKEIKTDTETLNKAKQLVVKQFIRNNHNNSPQYVRTEISSDEYASRMYPSFNNALFDEITSLATTLLSPIIPNLSEVK